MTEIRVENLVASYGPEPVLASLDLVIASGSLTCVLGESGCGKTTLLRVIAGFTTPTAGTVRIGARVVNDADTNLAPEKRRVGYVPQDGALFPHLTARQNVGFALARTTRSQRAQRSDAETEMLQLVAMGDVAERYPHELSGGQQQRVAVARALASRPDVVLLDEPFASLDAVLRTRLRDDVREVLRTAGVTAILVTHDRAEALSLGDRVAVIDNGRIRQTGTPRDLYTKPVDEHVAAFVGDANLIDGTIKDGHATTPFGVLRVDPACDVANGPARIVVRPEHIQIVGGRQATQTSCTVRATVTRVAYYGHDARVEADINNTTPRISIVARLPADDCPTETSQIELAVTAPVWALTNGDQRNEPDWPNTARRRRARRDE